MHKTCTTLADNVVYASSRAGQNFLHAAAGELLRACAGVVLRAMGRGLISLRDVARVCVQGSCLAPAGELLGLHDRLWARATVLALRDCFGFARVR